ncbi:MAG: radical SAM family heme chaperone HemW [Desulfobacteraceae bacterium]|nr:radical SAM family heme chaperone HemW [Desulfobacteraceae bacterium]MCF8094319.1 radical SAM family heme chaperone HemW [Desulfobacteraceae bacterium]
MIWGLYIHVPFCIRKCPYCDFYSIEDISSKSAYVQALVREISMRAASLPDAVFDTIYLGGGTPSVLDPAEVAQILNAVYGEFSILGDAEITIEANPGTITLRSLKEFRAAGVNRINIGVQSFNDDNLAFLDRIHSAKQAADALDDAKRAGFKNVGLDLIYGLPGQNKGSWQKDLNAAAAFFPAHISCYMFTIEDGTKMAADRDAGKFVPLCSDRVSAMFARASKFLLSKGYEHYEISNFADSRQTRSRHNEKYWQNIPYIGLGPAAHSYVEPERFWNCKNVDQYIETILSDRLPTQGSEGLAASQMMIEALYLGLRQADGIDIAEFKRRFETDFKEKFAPVLNRFINSGHIELDSGSCRLTRRGLLFLDTVAAHMAELI